MARRSKIRGGKRVVRDGPTAVLPTEFKEVETELNKFSMLLYGAKKIGKTSLCSEFELATYLMFEPGDKALPIRSVRVNTWKDARSLLEQLQEDDESDDPIHKTVIIDVVDRAYDLSFDFVCSKRGIAHPNDANDFGDSWNAVRKEWNKWISGLLALDKGVIFISHDRWNKIQRRDGTTIDRLGPTLTGQAMAVVEGLVDTIAYYGYNEDDRVLVIRGNEYIDAGTRIETAFLTPDGDFIRSIPMGGSKQEAYKSLIKAFMNRQKDIGEVPIVVPPQRKKKDKK